MSVNDPILVEQKFCDQRYNTLKDRVDKNETDQATDVTEIYREIKVIANRPSWTVCTIISFLTAAVGILSTALLRS